MTGRAVRAAWAFGGFIALGLGILGIPLPLLPTTPFLLLAAFCFSRSSRKLHDWLMHHPTLGPPIHDWRRHGAIKTRTKVIATVMMVGAFVIAWAMKASAIALIAQLIVLPIVGLFIWSRPSGPKASVEETPEH